LVCGKLFAHKASHSGIIAVEDASKIKDRMDYGVLPLAVCAESEFSSVGFNRRGGERKRSQTLAEINSVLLSVDFHLGHSPPKSIVVSRLNDL
jgi:pyruvate/2-oxoglutarate dehydrogenase complex dihydrolipoamide dehydrogenase (E3) component